MKIEIKVPSLGESINEVEVGTWQKKVGDYVNKDETIVDVESEKASVEIPCSHAGILSKIIIQTGEEAHVGDLLALIDTEAVTDTAGPIAVQADPTEDKAEPAKIMPAAKRIIEENNLNTDNIKPSGPSGRILKEDAIAAMVTKSNSNDIDKPVGISIKPESDIPTAQTQDLRQSLFTEGEKMNRGERRQRMSKIRRTIANRLVKSKQETAMLTTFNEVDMHNVVNLRKEMGPAFKERHGIKLGFMSFFVAAAKASLKEFPAINAMIDGDDIVYRNYYDIGIAVGSPSGLVVPILRDVDRLSFADIEKQIYTMGIKAKEKTLLPTDLQGGTFTISNGGVYGSMLSTPIINPPQSAILGLHAIKERPVAVDGEVVIRPVMYLALSYDHRIIDGREAVTFLKGIKERIENPVRIMLEI